MNESQHRARYEIEGEIAYEIRLRERHIRFYRRVRAVLAFIALAGAATAFSAVFNSSPLLRGLGGILIASAAFIDLIGDFATKVAGFEYQRRRLQALKAKAARYDEGLLDRKLNNIRIDDQPEIESLRRPCQNDVCRTLGHEAPYPQMTPMERVMDLVA